MQLNWKNVLGTQAAKPKEVDTESSPATVYLRKNIKKVDVKSGEETIKAWQYEEAELNEEEYESYKKEKEEMNTLANQASAENDLIIMGALSDEYDQQAAIQENQLIIMEALAEIYENTQKEV